jgi:hypothetical protein
MRYLEVSVVQFPEERNPMHQFVVERDAYGPARLLHREAVRAYELSPCPDDSF